MPGFSVSPEQRRAFDEDGFFVTAPAFSEAELAPVRAAIAAAWAQRRTERTRSEEARWDRLRPELPRLHRTSDAAAEFCRSPVFAAITGACIGPDADMMWNQAHVKAVDEAGLTRFPWHQDGAYAQMEYPDTVSCWVALTRCDARNGAMMMSPGEPQGLGAARVGRRAQVPGAPRAGARPPAGDGRRPDRRLPRGHGTCQPAESRRCPALRVQLVVQPSRAATPAEPHALRRSGARHPRRPPDRRGHARVCARREGAAGPKARPSSSRCAGVSRVRREAIDAAVRTYRAAVVAGDTVRSRRALSALFAVSEEDVSINGDLVRARNDPDAIVREYATLGPEITREQRRQLLLRALELDPEHAGAKAEIARLE